MTYPAQHAPGCRYPSGPPCLEFSTDGTRLGAQIAHTMGTTDEQEIINCTAPGLAPEDRRTPFKSDVDPEQADWDEPCWTCSGRGCPECQDEDTANEYWERKAAEQYGDSDPWKD